MVVAGEAGEAVVVVKPLGLTALAALDIAYGTDAGATSALDAAIGNDMKGLVGDEETLKEAPHGTGEEPWDRTACERAKRVVTPSAVPSGNGLNEGVELAGSLVLLLLLLGGRIDIHEGQSDIGLGHDDRGKELRINTLGAQMGQQTLHGATDGVACREDEVGVVGLSTSIYRKQVDKLPDKAGRTPAMNGKDEADGLMFSEGITSLSPYRVSHIDKPISQPLGKRLCCP